MADHLGGGGAAVGLRELGVTGERVDDVAGEVSAIGRRQRGALLAPEIVRNDQLVVVLRDHEIETGPLEVAVEQQMRRPDRTGFRVAVRREKCRQMPRDAGVGFEGQPEFAESARPPLRWLIGQCAGGEESVEQQPGVIQHVMHNQ